MPRSIEISAPPDKVDAILDRVKDLEGVVSLARQRGASLTPPGDVLSIQITTDCMRELLAILHDLEATRPGSVQSSETTSLISPGHQSLLDQESNETVWDEMAFLLRRDSNLSQNYLAAMALAGAIAASGLWLDKLHIVIGAMVIAPAFEPLVRLPVGLISGSRQLVPSALVSTGVGYLALALGALVATLILSIWNPGPAAALAEQQWVHFWSTVTWTAVLVSSFGGAAGAIVISGRRSVLTTGVMITLALIPSMAIVGMGIGVGDWTLAASGLARWVVDVVLVIVVSGIVFALKKKLVHHRQALS